MDFPSNTFAVQGQGAYMLYLEQKGKLLRSSKNHENRESFAQQNLPHSRYNNGNVYTLLLHVIIIFITLY